MTTWTFLIGVMQMYFNHYSAVPIFFVRQYIDNHFLPWSIIALFKPDVCLKVEVVILQACLPIF
jgi:hypothetical protein